MSNVSLKKYLKLQILSVNKDYEHLREKVKDNKKSADKEAGHIAMALKKQEEDYKKQFSDINPVQIDPIKDELKELLLWKSNQAGRQSRIFIIAIVSAIIGILGVVIAYAALVQSSKSQLK